MKHLTLLLPFTILAMGCIKVQQREYPIGDNTPGYILIEFNDSTTIQAATDICFKENIQAHEIGGFSYWSAMPPDSVEAIKSAFSSRNYIDKNSINSAVNKVAYSDQVVVTAPVFWDITKEDVDDWTLLEGRFQLTDHFYPVNPAEPGMPASITAKVPEGQERIYMSYLATKYSIVKRVSRTIKF